MCVAKEMAGAFKQAAHDILKHPRCVSEVIILVTSVGPNDLNPSEYATMVNNAMKCQHYVSDLRVKGVKIIGT